MLEIDLQSDVDDPTQEELRIAIQELDLISDLVAEVESDFGSGPPDFEFVGSQRAILAPADFVLPTGRTAIVADSWGQVKSRLSR